MDTTNGRKALVVGLGISGIATAVRLRSIGWTPVLIEKFPQRRTGGYFLGLSGAGRSAARRMGILDGLHDRTPTRPHSDFDRAGNRRIGVDLRNLGGLPWQMVRGDIEQAAFDVLPSDVEIRYSTVPSKIEQDDDGVDVTLTDTADGTSVTERFDLVVGADGLRSTVRSLAFGPHEKYLHRLNYMISAFEYPGAPGMLGIGEGGTLYEPDRSMWVWAFSDRNPTILLSYRTDDVDAEFTESPVERIRAVFGADPMGSTLGDVAAAMESADDVLFDSVEQVRMDSWHRGRVVLVGDAAWCPCLYSGMGASSALAGADLLGTMLQRHPDDLDHALTEWERKLRPSMDFYQQYGIKQRFYFTPGNHRQIALRRLMTNLFRTRLGPHMWAMMARGKANRMKEADIAAA